jgi:hypothetical protein
MLDYMVLNPKIEDLERRFIVAIKAIGDYTEAEAKSAAIAAARGLR